MLKWVSVAPFGVPRGAAGELNVVTWSASRFWRIAPLLGVDLVSPTQSTRRNDSVPAFLRYELHAKRNSGTRALQFPGTAL